MLTKKHQLIYDKNTGVIVFDIVAMHRGQETNIPKGLTGAEFDTKAEAEEFIKQKKLVYQEISEATV